jgi:hypothetical protein
MFYTLQIFTISDIQWDFEIFRLQPNGYSTATRADGLHVWKQQTRSDLKKQFISILVHFLEGEPFGDFCLKVFGKPREN